jgi:DNA-directed RNA polymerase specialized sigma24 family protein
LENSLNPGSTDGELPPDEALRQMCHKAVAALVARRGWTFLSGVEIPRMGNLVMREVQARWRVGERQAIATMVDESALGIYCEQWVAACRADEDIAQTKGYQALSDYLTVKLPYRLQDQEDDLAISDNRHLLATIRQEVLLKVRDALPTLQTPRTFLRWLGLLTNTVIRDFLTHLRGDAIAHSRALEEEDMLIAESPPRYILIDPAMRESVRRVLDGCLNDAVRLQIIEAFYLDELQIHEIAARLNMDTATVSQAKFRALYTLRRCRALLELLEDFEE